MNFGTIVELKEDIEQGYTTFPKGQKMAVAHYSHKYFVKLNTFGDEKNISDLLTVKFEDIGQKLTVVGQLQEQNEKRDIEQRIVGMEMVVDKLGSTPDLHSEFEVNPNQIYLL